MLIDFFSKLPNEADAQEVAMELLADYALRKEDPDDTSSEGMYRSRFLLELIANPHLNDIGGFVGIPGVNVQAAAAGKDGESVIVLASVVVNIHMLNCLWLTIGQLEHVVKLITDGTINVDLVLADMASNQDGKLKIKLPKVLNKQTGWEISAPFQFSSLNWNGDTKAYRESICKQGSAFASLIFAAVKAVQGSIEENDKLADINPHALLCMFFTSCVLL